MTKISTSLTKEEKHELVDQLIRNVDLFAWAPDDIFGIHTEVVCHHLVVNLYAKPMVQRKHKVGKEKRITVEEEVGKLSSVEFIRQTKYLNWLANVVLVWKTTNKWRMCVDFNDLKIVSPKDLYPLLDIYRLINESSDYHTLSFIDACSRCNQIRMDPMDTPKNNLHVKSRQLLLLLLQCHVLQP